MEINEKVNLINGFISFPKNILCFSLNNTLESLGKVKTVLSPELQ